MAIQTPYKTVGNIKGTNSMRIRTGTDGTAVAEGLLVSHAAEAPVVDLNGRYVGFISEMDVMKAIKGNQDLKKVQAEELMTRVVPSVNESTSIESALRFMEERNLMNLPVVRDGVLITTISRHDLLRVLLDAGLGIEQ